MSISSIRKFEIQPSNKSSADSVFSYKSGTPVISFKISPTDAYLLSDKLRFNCRIRVVTGAAATAAMPNGFAPNNTEATAALPAGPGPNAFVRQDPKTANVAALSQINISNSRNQTLELVKDLPRLYATLLGGMYGWREFSTYLGMMFGSSASTARQGVITSQEEQVVSMPLLAGMFLSGERIPLGRENGVNGLNIDLTLNPSIAALFGNDAAANGGSYIELRECSLSGAFGNPTGGRLPAIKGFGYTAFSSFYNVLTNNDEVQAINTALSSVISVFNNFIPTGNLSNWDRNGQLTLPPMNGNNQTHILNYSILKDGKKFPLSFRVDETINQENNYDAFEAERQRYFLSAVKPYRRIDSTLAGGISEGQPSQSAIDGAGVIGTGGGTVTGLGVRFDQLGTHEGTNFSNSTFSHRIQSGIDSTTPNSIYSYFLSKHMVSFPSPGMIAVSN